MAAAYLVQLKPECGQTVIGGNAVIVYAADATDAKALAAAKSAGDSTAMWADADVTAIAAGADLEGWRLRVAVLGLDSDEGPIDVTVTGAAAATVDTIGDLAVTALNALADVAAAAYNSGTNVLTVTGIADGFGDLQLEAFFYPPVGGAYGDPEVSIPSFIGSIVDGGVAGAVLSVVLTASTIPSTPVVANVG